MEAISSLIYTATTWAIPIVIAITFHEAAHGWVANRLGDDTAARLGRVTFNPFKHVDPFGTIVLPALLLLMRAPFLFGYAKPVPVNFARLKHPRRDMIWVALAGPGVNIALAFVCALGLHVALSLPGVVGEWLLLNLRNGLLINVVLAVFNLLPVPPLDGSRVVTGLLPPGPAEAFARLDRFGLLILLGLLFIVPMVAAQIGLNFNPMARIVMPLVHWTLQLITTLAGF